ncbi:glycosyltransferase family 4 protein [Cyanobium gracile]|uniref:Glycosyltransferase n=1 Tax=Cyanobium gracile (strain ATCC 27147 / PCC 6307) TaxID=292564 RepID=K9P395_CYAGP|nr:glycosyltransferase family 4 protein [Cyanobium gracile]AFY27560.1 glycosyltransferase [Cyanobium gracile PCC 6307]
MKALHLLPPGGTSWGGGIPATLTSLAESPQLQWVTFRQVPLDQAAETMRDWRPDALIWHPACSWRLLPQQWRLRGIPRVLVEHHYCRGFELHQVPSRRRFRTMLRLAYALFDRVVPVSHGQSDWMGATGLVPASKVRVIPFSRTLDDFLSLPLGRPPHTPFRLGAFGRFARQKGFDTLIRAVRMLPAGSVQLLLGGDGELDAELRDLAAGHPGIRFLGPLSNVPAFLRDCDGIAIPSLWEPWGNACLEVRAAGLPVIVSGVGGLSEQVEGCGFVVPPGSETGLADAIRRLIALPGAERLRLSEQARDSSIGSWDRFCRSWSNLLRELR